MSETIASLLEGIRNGYEKLERDVDFEQQRGTHRLGSFDVLNVSSDYLEEKYLTPNPRFSREWLNQLQEYVLGSFSNPTVAN
jgi:hypothetical protein